ncbi:MAG TPA: bifunctional folylpolyglutamate synthase/dihydrofolate synthase, partial [Methylomirabilota bacterium]|nr:bifunctional folylpolyglutamate synthase/dihydrofolate synthase [Methylomirabilota bacterium]
MTLHNIQEAESALLPYVPLVGQVKADTTLDRVWPLMELLGNPQDQLKTIHIAGTSGKTSTAYYMAALLAASGKKVGLTVSPHVDSVTERVQINGQPIPEELFCQELGEFLEIIEQAAQKPSYFELLYAFAIW